jgi:hypothetical protein
MSTDRDVTRIVRSWLHEDAHEDADRILNLVLDEIDTTPQRSASWLARRFPVMNTNLARLGIAAVVVVLAAFIGIQLLNGPNVGGPGPSPSESANPTPSEPEPPASAQAGLPFGPFVLWNAPGDVKITVAITAAGWDGSVGESYIVKDENADPPDGAGIIVYSGPLYVYGDPCQWETTKPDAPATTVDEFVAAIRAQTSRDASAPVDVTVAGFAGKSITLHVPDDAAFSAGEFTDCDKATFGSWTVPGAAGPDRFAQGPGQIDELWILDVDGTLVVLDAAYYAATSAESVAELRALAESATFEAP